MKTRTFRLLALTVLAAHATPAMRAAPAPCPTPPMGWNSFDSYGVYLHEKAALANIETMAEKLAPCGYVYFTIDNGWFGEYKTIPGTRYSAEKHASDININEYGYVQPSKLYFPNGLAPLINRCHELGLKFGVHLMRGIPRKAVELNLPIEGTPHRARDIIDTDPANQCKWCTYNYGVDMSKPGAQEWYDGLIRHLAEQGVDFIKYDDIVPYPREVEAVAEAIRKVERPIVFSLSPGGKVNPGDIASFKKANSLRVTRDIWDNQSGINLCFAAWRKWQGAAQPDFWIDMDMIPFGELQLMTPPSANNGGRTANAVALAGEGTRRWSKFSHAQMTTFITMRALAASPLIVGGDLVSLDPFSTKLLTDGDVIACNQNGIMGHLVHEDANAAIETWHTPRAGSNGDSGWIGVFNRSPRDHDVRLNRETLGLDAENKHRLIDIWNGHRVIAPDETVTIPALGVLFIRYEPAFAGRRR